MKIADRIVADRNTCSGYPRVEGTRIRIAHVIGWLAAGMSKADIIAEYPPLTAADIKACLNYAAGAIEKVPAAAE